MKTEDFNKELQSISNEKLIVMVRKEISKLASSGGRTHTMTVPPRIDDTDIILSEIARRFEMSLSTNVYNADHLPDVGKTMCPQPQWRSYTDEKPPLGVEVIAQSDNWIIEDYNPEGIRIGFQNASDDEELGEFISAQWDNTHDCYDTITAPEYGHSFPTKWTSLIPDFGKTEENKADAEKECQCKETILRYGILQCDECGKPVDSPLPEPDEITYKCNRCGSITTAYAEAQHVGCCCAPVDHRTSGICGGELINITQKKRTS